MDSVFSVLCSNIESATGLSTGIAHPKSAKTQIVLWPWRITSPEGVRTPLRRFGAPIRKLSKPNLRQSGIISFLLISESGLDNLPQVASYLSDNPVLLIDDMQYRIHELDFPQELQVAIFSASDIPLQPAVSYALEG